MSGYHVATEHKLAMLRYAGTDECLNLLLAIARDALDEPASNGRVSDTAIHATAGWARGIAFALENAVPYYWSPETCDALSAAAASIPDFTLRREDLPTPAGYLYFSRPLKVHRESEDLADPETALGDLVAISWQIFSNLGRPTLQKAGPTSINEAEMTDEWWNRTVTNANNIRVADGVAVNMYVQTAKGRTIPISNFSWDFGQSCAEVWQRGHVQIGNDGKPLFSEQMQSELQYFSAALMFMQQEIFPTRRETLPRSTRRRLLAQGYDPGSETMTPNVVYLRRVSHKTDSDDDVEHREYTSRFWVRGHWRNQWYETDQRHKPIWIHPFIKGPDDKPIAARRETLVAVVR